MSRYLTAFLAGIDFIGHPHYSPHDHPQTIGMSSGLGCVPHHFLDQDVYLVNLLL
jgi:hypothetical protein